MPLSWIALRDQMTWTQQLMFMSARWDSVDEERVRADLLSMRRKSYNDELGIQAGKVGCPGMTGRLGNGDILSALNDASKTDAASIANTYNYYLALEIIRAGQENPRGNRNYYAAKIAAWQPTYWAWKDPQIEITTEKSARQMAQEDFYRMNGGALGYAKLEPQSAVCPVCQGFVARGVVKLSYALAHPAGWHPGCLPNGELVTMADGTTKKIEEVGTGDCILSSAGQCMVKRVFERPTQETLYTLYVGHRVLRLTGDHPVLTTSGWLPARDLKAGTQVLGLNNESVCYDNPDKPLLDCADGYIESQSS
jgi:hypothetical protein